jgi:hypothetical protein
MNDETPRNITFENWKEDQMMLNNITLRALSSDQPTEIEDVKIYKIN